MSCSAKKLKQKITFKTKSKIEHTLKMFWPWQPNDQVKYRPFTTNATAQMNHTPIWHMRITNSSHRSRAMYTRHVVQVSHAQQLATHTHSHARLHTNTYRITFSAVSNWIFYPPHL